MGTVFKSNVCSMGELRYSFKARSKELKDKGSSKQPVTG
jgi:hypothetical protein